MATERRIGLSKPSQLRADVQNESLDLSDDDTQQPLPAPPPNPVAPSPPPSKPPSSKSLPLKPVTPTPAVKVDELAAPPTDEHNQQESEESVLFSHPQAKAPDSDPHASPTWATGAQVEAERAAVTDTSEKGEDEAEHNELNESYGPSALKKAPSVPTPASREEDSKGVTGDHEPYTSDAPPSVATQPSPHNMTTPSHSEAEDLEEEADSVSSPHSSHHDGSPPLFPQTPSKAKPPASANGSPLTPLTGLARPKVTPQSRDTHTTSTNLGTVTSPTRARNWSNSRALPFATVNGRSSRSSRSKSRDSSPESSDFTHGMKPQMRGAKAYRNLVSRSLIRDDSPQHDDDDLMESTNPTDPSGGSSIPPLEATFLNGPSSPLRDQMRTSSVPRRESSTQLNSDPTPAPHESPTQRNEMEVAVGLSMSEDRRLARLDPPSEDGAAGVPGDAELFGETMDSEPSPQNSSQQSQNYSFQATQVLNPAMESQSPAKSLPPIRPVARTASTTSANSGLPEYRLLKRRDRSSAFDTPPVQPRQPSPIGDAEQTYIDTYQDPSNEEPENAVEGPSAEPAEPDVEVDEGDGDGDGDVDKGASSVQSDAHPRTPPPPPDYAEVMDIDPPQDAPALTGIHEIEDGSLERDPVARPSPNKYTRKGKARSSPLPSSSSSSAPEDPEDNTFQPPTQTQEPSVSPLKEKSSRSTRTSPSKPINASKSSKGARSSNIVSSRIGSSRSTSVTSSRVDGRPPRNKRKAFSPTPSFSGDSDSSSAPEDLEDNTYRPQKKKAKRVPVKAEKKPQRTSKGNMEKASEPQLQAGPSTRHASVSRSRSSRAASAAVGPIPTPIPTQQTIADEPLRVLALWSKTKDYYAGTVTTRNKTGYRVSFDDGLSRSLSEDKMRLFRLRKGETVWCGNNAYTMIADFDGQGDSFVAREAKKKGEEFTILTKDLVVAPEDINKHFGDRFVPLIELETRFPAASGTKRSSLASVAEPATPAPVPEFDGKIFLITGDLGDAVKTKIEDHGGHVVSDWEAVFTIRDDSYELAVAGVPFLIQNSEVGTMMTPKVMAALAAGVPILSARYVDTAIAGGPVWWRNFLVAAGHSTFLGNYASQDVDDNWGGDGWDAATARSKRQPLVGRRVLFVEPSAKFDRGKGLKVLVRFCLLALGASVQCAAKFPASVEKYDLVVVENRDKAVHVPDAMVRSGKLANVVWLKSCLLTGHLLPPGILSELS